MSSFDHDAWMKRGAELQAIVEEQLRTFHNAVEKISPTGSKYHRLAWVASEFLLSYIGGPLVTLTEGDEHLLRAEMEKVARTLRGLLPQQEERDKALLDLARKLLESAVGPIISRHSAWESRAFGESKAG